MVRVSVVSNCGFVLTLLQKRFFSFAENRIFRSGEPTVVLITAGKTLCVSALAIHQ